MTFNRLGSAETENSRNYAEYLLSVEDAKKFLSASADKNYVFAFSKCFGHL